MSLLRLARAIQLIAVVGVAGCVAGESSAPAKHTASAIAPISDLSRSLAAGAVAGGMTVRVTDASGSAVAGVTVGFTVTVGNGSVNPRLAVTDANGQATTTWTVGTIIGRNEVTASVEGVDGAVSFSATGPAGSPVSISLSTRRARLLSDVELLRFTAKALDAFGNATGPDPVFTVRDPSL